jgi:hypothetical protein
VLCEIAYNSTVVLIRLHLEDVKHCCTYQKVFGNLHAFFDDGSPLKALPCHVVDRLTELMGPKCLPQSTTFCLCHDVTFMQVVCAMFFDMKYSLQAIHVQAMTTTGTTLPLHGMIQPLQLFFGQQHCMKYYPGLRV